MREVVEVWLRLQIVRTSVSGRKMSRKFVNQAAKFVNLSGRKKISIEFISQAAITSLVVKKTHVVFEQLDLNFKQQKRADW